MSLNEQLAYWISSQQHQGRRMGVLEILEAFTGARIKASILMVIIGRRRGTEDKNGRSGGHT
jgi:hypothetical protein